MTISRSSASDGTAIKEFIDELKRRVTGSVKDDEATRIVYRVDASIFSIEPLAVFQPLSREDVLIGVKVALEHNIPIIPRGAATGITGGCLGYGLVIDLSKHLDRILDINIQEEFAVVEPGVIQDDLNRELASKGYRLGPETSTGNRATLGGMLANNAAGSESLRFGSMADHILEVELVTAAGKFLVLKNTPLKSPDPILNKLLLIRERYKEAIENEFPKIPRISSGYRLDKLISNPFNPAALIAGSEGTLGIITKMKLKIEKVISNMGMLLLEFDDLIEALALVPEILKENPLSLELIDHHIIESGKKSRVPHKIPLKGNPKAVLIVQFEKNALIEKASRFNNATPIFEKQVMQAILRTRKAGLGLLLSKRDYSRAIAFIEDLSIPPNALSLFMSDFLTMLSDFKKTAGIYGHAGSGCLHIRPYIDLRSQDEQHTMIDIMNATLKLVLKYGGVLSGEHGDGLIRSSFNQALYGETLYKAFRDIKDAFDIKDLMNPGKIVGFPSPLENLRSFPDTKKSLDTFFDFTKEGGFELAVDLCNGNALCRKKEGVMCPSFQATHDEYDTTRARAEMLRAYISQEKGFSLTDEKILDVLDLCLMCKGCKKECPSEVDMAKIKAEVLYHAPKSLRSILFGHMGSMLKVASKLYPIIKFIPGSFLEKWIKKWLKISKEHPIPFPARKRFSHIYKNGPLLESSVVLFNDTFNEFLYPNIGINAVKVLQAHGFSVHVPPYHCCGRTFISKGMLKQALQKSVHLVQTLYPYAMKGIPIIGLEPSCILTLRDETLSLIAKQRPDLSIQAEIVAKSSFTFEEFFSEYIKEEGPLKVKCPPETDLILHTHCHEMADVGRDPARHILNSIGASIQEVPAGCCGMAGSFGYEEEHYELSMKIANLKLFPFIEKTKGQIVANGTSCRSQILSGQKKEAIHMAELLSKYITPQ